MELSKFTQSGNGFMLATTFDSKLHNPQGMWMSEKLDGVRGLWDGVSCFYSRLGNRLCPPPWFAAAMPRTPLDGELWTRRGDFQNLCSIVKTKLAARDGAALQQAAERWREVTFVVFDAPFLPGPFEARIAAASQLIRALPAPSPEHPPTASAPASTSSSTSSSTSPSAAASQPVIRALEQIECTGVEHLEAFAAGIEAMEGEGVCLRRRGSPYAKGRTDVLLKFKKFSDAEAVVRGHIREAHAARVTALAVETPLGVAFRLGTGLTEEMRARPPKIGSVVTYRYQSFTKSGCPRFPVFVGVRFDLSWDQLLADAGGKPAPSSSQPPSIATLHADAMPDFVAVPSKAPLHADAMPDFVAVPSRSSAAQPNQRRSSASPSPAASKQAGFLSSFSQRLQAALEFDSDDDQDYDPREDGYDPEGGADQCFSSEDESNSSSSHSSDDEPSNPASLKAKPSAKPSNQKKIVTRKPSLPSTPSTPPTATTTTSSSSSFGSFGEDSDVHALQSRIASIALSPNSSRAADLQRELAVMWPRMAEKPAAELQQVRVGDGLPLLHAAAQLGDVDKVASLLAAGYSPLLTDSAGWTARRHALNSASKAQRFSRVESMLHQAMVAKAASIDHPILASIFTLPLPDLKDLGKQLDVPHFWLGSLSMIQEKVLTGYLLKNAL